MNVKRSLALVIVLILVAAGATAASGCPPACARPYRGYTGAEQFVDDQAGDRHTRRSASGSSPAGVVRDQLTFRVALWLSGRATRLKAGEYRFTDQLPRPATSSASWRAATCS